MYAVRLLVACKAQVESAGRVDSFGIEIKPVAPAIQFPDVASILKTCVTEAAQ